MDRAMMSKVLYVLAAIVFLLAVFSVSARTSWGGGGARRITSTLTATATTAGGTGGVDGTWRTRNRRPTASRSSG
jgi:hypothetical protein